MMQFAEYVSNKWVGSTWFNHHLRSCIDILFLSPLSRFIPFWGHLVCLQAAWIFKRGHRLIFYAAVEGKKQQRKSYSRTPTWNWQASLPLKINGWFRWVLSRLRRPSLFSDGINSRDLTWLDLHSEVKELCQKMSLPSNIWHRGCRMHLFFSSDSISYVRFAFHIAWLEITFPL